VIRAALEEAIAQLKQPQDIEEPPEAARREGLHLDHDTKDVTGMPDVAATILEKIDAATVFVGDVTPVGATPPVKGNEGVKPGRPLMNPNVAIELGYALRSISDKNVLAVLNLAYGDETGLPFDIKHKRWPIKYQLVEEATSTEIKAQQKVLKDQFITALRGFISEPAKLESTFAETPPRVGKAFYFEDGLSLGHARQLDLDMYMPFRDVLYLRIIPMKPLVRPLAEQLMVNNVGKYGSFGQTSGGAFLLRNEWGVAAFDPAGHTENIDSILQYFPNGEIWGINADIMRQGNRGDESWYLATMSEHAFAETLFHALAFMKNTSKVELPVRVVAGVVGLKGRRLVVPGTAIGSYGRMMTDSVEYEAILRDDSLEAQDKLLLALFEKIFDQSGQPRPEKLGGFPPDRK
jgi:hypothetical protein